MLKIHKTDISFDLEKVRLEILEDKITDALKDFTKKPGIQWTTLKLEEVLLETLLELVKRG